jgi:hypothetical protein
MAIPWQCVPSEVGDSEASNGSWPARRDLASAISAAKLRRIATSWAPACDSENRDFFVTTGFPVARIKFTDYRVGPFRMPQSMNFYQAHADNYSATRKPNSPHWDLNAPKRNWTTEPQLACSSFITVSSCFVIPSNLCHVENTQWSSWHVPRMVRNISVEEMALVGQEVDWLSWAKRWAFTFQTWLV